MNNMLEDKVCVITGAGKGFGRELALRYFQEGANLALITRSQEDVDELLKLLPDAYGKRCLISVGDVSNKTCVENFIQKTNDRFGRIDVLINNAGMRFRRSFLDIKEHEFNLVMQNNFFSMVYLCQAVIPIMQKFNQGKIVNMSSIAGTLGLADLSGYICSKSAVVGLTKSLAVEFALSNIQINAIAPGFAKTSYFDRFKENKLLYEFTLSKIPMKRWAESIEIANACLFLSSSLSDYVTGEVLTVDGGWSAG